jgi:alanyl-tRNA synthetase
LTRDVLREKGFSVDEDSFNVELDKQRTRSRADTAVKIGSTNLKENKAQFGHPPTIFRGYDNSSIDVKLFDIWPQYPQHKAIWSFEEPNAIILESTPFYAEAGGQVGDAGIIEWDNFRFEVKNTIRDECGVVLHLGKFLSSVPTGWPVGATVKATVIDSRRRAIMRAHTATHLMHAALRQVLGDHVKQAGSMVEDDRLRFDFSHYEAVSYDDLLKVTHIVNNWIIQSHDVDKKVMAYNDAIKTGAMALFGEKYEADVRVISIGDVSMELCGGTHLDNSSKIGPFVIIREESIASGTRRIEALTGERAIHHFLEGEKVLKDLSSKFAVGSDLIESTVDRIFEERKSLEKELGKVRAEAAKSMVPDIIAKAEKIGDTSLMIHKSQNMSADALMAMAETIRVKAGSHAALLIGVMPDKIGIVISVSDDLIKKGIKAGDLVREICKTLGGGGGGRPNLAQGGGKDASQIENAQKQFAQIVKEKLG